MTKYIPYWWEDQPNYKNSSELPLTADVVIVGAGFTGLSAAITLAKSGLSVVVSVSYTHLTLPTILLV